MVVEDLADELDRVREAVGEVVVGYEDTVTDLLVGLVADGHVLLIGVPGVAKTTLAKSFARAIGLEFGRIQFTQDMLPADVTGHYYYDRSSEAFEVRKGPVFANLLLADEVNRAPPKTQSALLEAMQEDQVTIEGDTLELPSPFLVLATLNPVDVEGVYHLPEAQLDRFTLRTTMAYLDDEAERSMLTRVDRDPDTTDVVLSPERVQAAQEAAEDVTVGDPVVAYIQAIGTATRDHAAVELGASPRALEHLLRASRAHALLEARDYVIPEDVRRVAPSVLAHRLILDVDAEIEGRSDTGIVEQVLDATPVPKGLEDEPAKEETVGDEQTSGDGVDEPVGDPPPTPAGDGPLTDGRGDEDLEATEEADEEEEDAEDEDEDDEDRDEGPSVAFEVKDIFEDW